MHTIDLALQSVSKVLVVALVLGAGLPALFAVGVRGLAFGRAGDADLPAAAGAAGRPHPAGLALAVVCFTVVVGAILLGITFIVASGSGYALSFEHVVPTFVPK